MSNTAYTQDLASTLKRLKTSANELEKEMDDAIYVDDIPILTDRLSAIELQILRRQADKLDKQNKRGRPAKKGLHHLV